MICCPKPQLWVLNFQKCCTDLHNIESCLVGCVGAYGRSGSYSEWWVMGPEICCRTCKRAFRAFSSHVWRGGPAGRPRVEEPRVCERVQGVSSPFRHCLFVRLRENSILMPNNSIIFLGGTGLWIYFV